MLIPKVVDDSASSNVQPPIFWYVVCIHEMHLLARWTPKSVVSVKSKFSWPKTATKMILITLLTKLTPPNEIIYINDHPEVWICDFWSRYPPTSDSATKNRTVKNVLLMKIIYPRASHYAKISVRLEENCRFFTITIFLIHSYFLLLII